jgi:endonuclease/exonuclease/phosphatase family metal-dependent hydrolase
LLGSSYDFILAWKYSQKKAEKVQAFLRSINSMGADYLLLGDLNAHPCFPEKRQAVLRTYAQLDAKQVIIVIREIESWYLAGLPDDNSLGVRPPPNTSTVTKEQFNGGIPERFDSRIDYMVEVLKLFDIHTATERNPSFHYFARRCGLLPS